MLFKTDLPLALQPLLFPEVMTALAPAQRQLKRPRASRVIAPSPRLFSVDDFHHTGAVGILKPADRVELLGGEIVNLAPIDPIHAESTDLGQHCLIAH